MRLKSVLKRVANAAGLKTFKYGLRGERFSIGLQIRRVLRTDFAHSPLLPTATYSPWLENGDFKHWYGIAKDNTLVDEYRCYEIWKLAGQAVSRPGDLLEVGVWRGGTGAIIAGAVKESGKTTYLADTFTGVVKVSAKDGVYRDGAHSDTSREIVEILLDGSRLCNARILQGIFPDAFPEIAAKQFCFVHIDVDIYQSAKDVFEAI